VLAHSFDAALRLLQPIVPFITDILWRRLPVDDNERDEYIARAAWPVRNDAFNGEQEFELVREAINAIRQLRADYAIAPGERIHASLDVSAAASNADRDRTIFEDESDFIARIARCDFGEVNDSEAGASILLSSGSRIRIPLAGVIDIEKECRKARTELEKLDAQLTALDARLANPGFTDRAPANVVAQERAKQLDWRARRAQLSDKVTSLCG
jgi:valyl-tRNA synthetase